MKAVTAPLLRDIAPELVPELQRLLTARGEHGLAAKAAELVILRLCPCSDDFYSTFYSAPQRSGDSAPGRLTIELAAETGILNVDIEGADIVGVEILFRDELRAKIRAAFSP